MCMQGLEKPKAKTCPFDFDNMTFGQFVDMDVLTHEGLNKNLEGIISLLWDMPVDLVADSPLEYYMKGIQRWAEKRNEIYRAYSVFFGLNEQQDYSEEAEGADIRRTWYQAIITLAGEDFLKINQVVERPVYEALNYLAYMKTQAQQRALEHKRQMAKLKNN
jgi:hypothetical protein